MENNEQVGFGLRQITTEQFAIIDQSYDDTNSNVEINNNLRFGVDAEKRIVAPLLAVTFLQNQKPFLILEIGCYFEVVDENWTKFFNPETKELILPQGFATHLVFLAIGTLRGVLHAKTENTPFNKFFLPTINVNDLVKDDIKIKVE